MESNKYDKKQKRKIVVIFSLTMLVCFFLGIFFGVISERLKVWFDGINWPQAIYNFIYPIEIFYILMVFGVFIFSVVFFKKTCRKIAAAEGLEDEEYSDCLEEAERNLALPMIVQGATTFISFFLFALLFYFDVTLEKSDISTGATVILPSLIVFILCLVFYMYINNIVVEKIKDLHPEKQGSVLELNFRKKWLESCDEAETLQIAKKSQKAYFAGMTTAIVLWLVSFFGLLCFDTGILPILICCIIMLVMFLAASVEGKKKKDKTEE